MKYTSDKLKTYTIENDKIKAKVTNYGATLLELWVSDKKGEKLDVILGYEKLEDYFDNPPAFGCCVLPNANRIGNASFDINGKEYVLDQNDGKNSLHSGFEPLHKRLWSVINQAEDSITFSYDSPDMECGFPGNRHFEIRYTLIDNSLEITYSADTDKVTVFNPTNHSYFNLNGHNSGDILSHELTINSSAITYSDSESICNGELVNVTDTPWDFRTPKAIGKDINSSHEDMILKKGYDHNYVLESEHAATLLSKDSGIKLDIYTDVPGLQIYTGNYLAKSDIGKGNYPYAPNYGVALETQFFPNSVNVDSFEKPYLYPDEPKVYTSTYKFDLI